MRIRFSEVGGVVHLVNYECESDTADQRMRHAAMLLARKEIQRRTNAYAERTSKELGIRKIGIFPADINDEAAKKSILRRITWKEFLAPRYDFNRSGLIVRVNGDVLNYFFFYRDPAKRENVISPDGIDYGIGTGFADTFSLPPYPIQLSAEEHGEMFDKFLHFIVGGSDDSLPKSRITTPP